MMLRRRLPSDARGAKGGKLPVPAFEGKLLLVANPAAQNGAGAVAAGRAEALLRDALGAEGVDVALTEHAGQAARLAQAAAGYACVAALGGDGVIHEVTNGLLRLPRKARPALGVIPVGSGNDYARSLGISGDLGAAVRQLLGARPRALDVGCCNGRFFVETLSFGLDAAIALDTVQRRRRTGRTGTLLYLESGIDQLLHHLKAHRYAASFDGGPEVEGSAFLFAVQVGPTYGGGFRVCPDARLDDGLFDLCLAHPPLSVPRAVGIFLLAKNGRHTRFRQMEMRRAASLRVRFDEAVPAQMDGEEASADLYDIAMMPRALDVLMPA